MLCVIFFASERSNDGKTSVQVIVDSGRDTIWTANSDKPVVYYNLDVVIAVGYRVNSYKATQFRIWATQILKEYLVKGFALDDERLKLKMVLCFHPLSMIAYMR